MASDPKKASPHRVSAAFAALLFLVSAALTPVLSSCGEEKVTPVNEDVSFNAVDEFALTKEKNPYYGSYGIFIPESTHSKTTGELVKAVALIGNAVVKASLSSVIPKDPPEKSLTSDDVKKELLSREDAAPEILSAYYTYTGSLLRFDEEQRRYLKPPYGVWGICVVNGINEIRDLVSNGIFDKLTKADKSNLLEREKEYLTFLAKYYCSVITPLEEVAAKLDFDTDALKIADGADCSAYDHEYKAEDREASEGKLMLAGDDEIIDLVIDTVNYGVYMSGRGNYTAIGVQVEKSLNELEKRENAAALVIERYNELVRITPAVKSGNESTNIYFAKQALRLLMDRQHTGRSILDSFTEEQLRTIASIMILDSMRSVLSQSADCTDLFYRLTSSH